MATFARIAPIFAVRDLDAALAHYEQLGFTTRAYEGGGYGFGTRDGVELHLGVVPPDRAGAGTAHLFVDDTDDLAHAWLVAGAEVHPPQDTEWGQHEGALTAPDGNIIRFGSPIKGGWPSKASGPGLGRRPSWPTYGP
jgi:hypothetical protein